MARLAFVFDQFRSAFRTVRDELERLAAGRTFGQINAGNFRNNFAALFHIDHIAEPDIEQRDLFGIVQRSPFDGCTGQRHRIEVGDRRHRPGTPDLKIDRQQPGAGLFRFEFIGYGPARSLGRYNRADSDRRNGSL